MFLITDMFFSTGTLNSLLWFSFRLLLKSRSYCSVEDNHQQKHHIFVRLEPENSVFLHLLLLSFTPVASNSFSFPSLRLSYTATLSNTCFCIFLPSRIKSGEQTDVGRQRLNHSSLSPSRFSKLNRALDTNDYNWWRAFIFHPQKPQTRSDLSSARNILFARITSNEPVCWGLKQVLGTNLIPLRTKFDTQTTGMPVACYQSTLISETSFFRQWYFPWSGRSTNGILWGIVASSLFPCPRGFAARSCVLARLASLAQNKTACSQAIRRQV